MVDEGRVGPERVVAQLDEHFGDVGLNLVVILDIVERVFPFVRDAELERVVEVVDELEAKESATLLRQACKEVGLPAGWPKARS